MRSKNVPHWVWTVLVGIHLLALGWAVSKGAWSFPDSGRYEQAAENLWLHGQLYAQPWLAVAPEGQAVQEFTIRPLGYPVVVLGLGQVFQRPVLLLLFQNLLSLLGIGVVLKWWAHKCLPTTKEWVWAVAAVLSFPAQFIYANAVMSEVLLQAVVVCLMGGGCLFVATGRMRYWGVAAAAGIAALLVKPVFLPFAFVLAVLGMWRGLRERRAMVAVIGFVPLLVASLYMGWNWQRTGYFHFSSIAEINALHYNAAGVLRQLSGPAAEEKWVAEVLRGANAQPSFALRQQWILAKAVCMMQAHPWLYARQHVQGMFVLFLDPGRFDISQFLKLERGTGTGLLAQARSGGLLQALGRLPFGMMGVLGLVLLANVGRLVLAARGLWLLRSREPALRYGRWIAVGLLLYVAFLTGPLGAARFLVPVWPLLLGLALVGISGSKDAALVKAKEPTPVRENQG